MADLRSFRGAAYQDGNVIGNTAYQAARSSGLSAAKINRLLGEQGLRLGTAAQKSYASDLNTAPTYTGLRAFKSPEYADGQGFGLSAYNRARASGLSAQELGQQAGSQGFFFAEKAKAQYQTDLNQELSEELAAARQPANITPAAPAPLPPPPGQAPAPMAIRGNATGVARKKSRAEKTGRNASGTNQLNRSMFINPVAPLSNINV